jgi:hypothetical protein
MKQIYLKGAVPLAFIAFSINPYSLFSQCTCSGGLPATAIEQTVTIAPSKVSTLNFTFQQFDPSIGNLSCVTLYDTITGSSVTGVRNTAARGIPKDWDESKNGPYVPGPPIAEDSIAYLFQLTLVNLVSGPGIDISDVFLRTYGRDTLSYYGTPGDTITYGPENIITNPNGIGKTGGNAAYLGNGTVSFTYSINGGLITLQGGSNYRQEITTEIGGKLKLVYYWCPAIPLGSTIKSFTVFKKDGTVSLQWLATNDQSDITYEIQYSQDGESWADAGTVPAGSAPAGTVAEYQYQYHPAATDVGEIFFRIKRSDGQGNISYSEVKVINLQQADQLPGIRIYPNPVSDRVTVQFDEAQTGTFRLELINTTGQVVQQSLVQLTGNRLAAMELSGRPARGIYFLRARDTVRNRQFLAKVIVN